MKKPEGIKIKAQDYTEEKQEIRDYVVSLGGRDFRYWVAPDGAKVYDFPASREGACSPRNLVGQECFGERQVKGVIYYDTVLNVRQRCHSRYVEVKHITLEGCTSACFGKGTVVCVREVRSGGKYITHHIVGKCPYCDYELHDYFKKKLEDAK